MQLFANRNCFFFAERSQKASMRALLSALFLLFETNDKGQKPINPAVKEVQEKSFFNQIIRHRRKHVFIIINR